MWADGIPEGVWNADARTSDFSLQRIIPRSKQPKALRFELYGADSAQGAGSELYRGLPPVSPLIEIRGLKRLKSPDQESRQQVVVDRSPDRST